MTVLFLLVASDLCSLMIRSSSGDLPEALSNLFCEPGNSEEPYTFMTCDPANTGKHHSGSL